MALLQDEVRTALEAAHMATAYGRVRLPREPWEASVKERPTDVMVYLGTMCDALEAITLRLASEVDTLRGERGKS